MLLTELVTPQFMGVKCNYSLDYVNRFRKIPGARFEKENKRWLVPVGAMEWFEEQFQGEIVYKTPRWVILDEPMPDYSKMYTLRHNIPLPVMKLNPFDYQKYGIKFMVDKLLDIGFVINADDVGLGKTIQAIGTMKYMHESKGVNRVLIACKKSIKRQWCAEIRKFTDLGNSMCIMPIEGDKKKRQKLYDEFKTYRDGIMVMNYHVVMNDYKELEKMGFDMLVIDEAHCVKARTGEMNGALKKVGKKADYIVFLTGTPIMSKPEDIFGVIQIADDKYFGKWTDFQKKHIRIENNGRYQKTIGYKELDDLRAKVQDIVIRRTEFEVTLELPETIMDKIECDIDNTQIKIKEAIQEYKGKLAGTVDTIRNKVSRTPQMQQQLEAAEGMLKGLIAADQALANDPRLFHTSKSKAMREQFGILIPQSYTRSNKMEALIELVQTILDADEKVIIFSKFETSALLVKSDIETTLKEKVLLYSGQVGEEEREQNVELFKNSFDHNVIVGTDAMAEGLNLQVANHVINFDQPDNPAIKTQRGGRARRAGSRYKKVFVHDLITVDSKDVERLVNIERAQGLFDGVVSLNNAQSEAIKKAIAAEN